jgi:hypothetical protein
MSDNFRKPDPFSPDVVVDIDSVFNEKAIMVNCHKSQFFEWLPWLENELSFVPESEAGRFEWLIEKLAGWDKNIADHYREKLFARYGRERGMEIKYAEAFEVSEYGGNIPEDLLMKMFPF